MPRPGAFGPVRNFRGQVIDYQLRPDEPRIDVIAGPVEYENCDGQRFVIDVPSSCLAQLADPRVTLYLTDAVRQADSAASQGLCCIALLGLSRWDETEEGNLPLPDWEQITLARRQVWIVFDVDMSEIRL